MAVSGKTTELEWPYYLGTDKPPDLAAVTKAQAERAEALFVGTAGEVLIANSKGVPVPKVLKGDATLAEDGTLRLANSGKTYQGTAVTRTSEAMGAFSTPIKFPLPHILENQLVEVFFLGVAKASVASNIGGGGFLEVHFGGNVHGFASLYEINEEKELAANTKIGFMSGPKYNAGIPQTTAFWQKLGSPEVGRGGQALPRQLAPITFIAESDIAAGEGEFLGKCTGAGTITAEKVWVMVRVSG